MAKTDKKDLNRTISSPDSFCFRKYLLYLPRKIVCHSERHNNKEKNIQTK